MKVHIYGKGMISLLGLNAPVRNLDLPETKIRALVIVPSLKVYDAETNLVITPRNVDKLFEEKNAPVEEAPVKPASKKKEKKAEPVPVPVKEEPVEAVNDVIITEPTPVTEEPAEAPVEEEAVEEGIVVGESVEEEDVPATDEDAEEESVEETEEEAPAYNNKKKNKKRR